MDSITGWVKQPKPAGGLDHLGSQAPCINIYGKLLPGITNVTDRARYYSFYPWFLWTYEQEHPSIKWAELVDAFRKADCLFTLIAARHANKTDQEDENHGIGMVGRNTLVGALRRLEEGQRLFLSTHATTETGNPNRYFKSKLGGLGQYYIGPFNELGLLDGNSRIGVKYTRERGQVIAEAMDIDVDRKLFFKTLKRDKVSLDALDQLSMFCPCHLTASPQEHAALVDLFFDRHGIYGIEGKQRRKTLCLIMHLIDELKNSGGEGDWPFGHHIFRAATYTGSLPGDVPWKVPEALDGTREAWAVYQRNETLSLACQGVFWVALTLIRESETIFRDTSDFACHFLKSKEVVKALRKRKGQRFPDAVREMKSRMPGLKDWENAGHEFSLTQWIQENHAGEPHERTLQCGVDALLCLAARENGEADPYGALEFPEGYFTYYPINLRAFRHHCTETWSCLTLQEFLGWIAHHWGLETHLRVALRKLRGNGLNTFKLQPTENGLRVTNDIPPPVYTAPRFRQGLRMLRDLGAVVPTDDEQYELTELGRKLLGETVGN